MFLRSASTGDRPSDPQPLKAAGGGYPNSLAGLSANAGADEGKVTLIFCVIRPYFCMPPRACYFCIKTDKFYKTDETEEVVFTSPKLLQTFHRIETLNIANDPCMEY